MVDYIEFHHQSRYEKTLNTLEGIIAGIGADRRLLSSEYQDLLAWCDRHHVTDDPLIDEVVEKLREFLSDGILDLEEKEDLLATCRIYSEESTYWNAITADMQRLHGICKGIAADRRINEQELAMLRDWMEEHSMLRGLWPYDEIDSIVTHIMADGRVDQDEEKALIAFIDRFVSTRAHSNSELSISLGELTINGICSTNCDIVVEERAFCFTGGSTKGGRKIVEDTLASSGGIVHKNVRRDTDYLVICTEENCCWAFTHYGRKIERAMRYRRAGKSPIQLIAEIDFWDAMANPPPSDSVSIG